MRDSYTSFGHGNGIGTRSDGRPTASSCAARMSWRTPCMLTRPKVSVTVVSAPTISQSPARRASWRAQALSLPLDQAISAFGRVISAPAGEETNDRVGGTFARFPGAADRAPQGLVHRLAGEEHAVAD